MKKNQLAKLALTLGLVAVVSVGGTMALLSAQSNTVTNTFTVGKGLHDTDIELNEAKVNPETGEKIEPEERVFTNEYKNLEQGAKLDKDPTVTIKNKAANCYVFVKIEEVYEGKPVNITKSEYYDVTIDDNWMPVNTDGLTEEQKKTLNNVYVYTVDKTQPAIVKEGLTKENGIVFNGVIIKDKAPLFDKKGEEWVAKEKLPQIVVKACAVQANNVTYENALKSVTFKK